MSPNGDFLALGQHADVRLRTDEEGDNFSYWWFDTPVKGKCLSAEYIPENYPQFAVSVRSNTKARRSIAFVKRNGWEEF